jgi:hypothetical protein
LLSSAAGVRKPAGNACIRGDAKTRHATAVDCSLPAGELFEAEAVALTCLVDGQKAAGDCSHHFGLAPHYPPGGGRRRKRVQGEGLAKRTDHLMRTKLLVL